MEITDLSNNIQLDLDTGHDAAVRILDGGGGMVGSTAEEARNDVGNLRDGDHESLSTAVGPGVEGGGARLGKVGRTEILWDHAQYKINIIRTAK